MTSGQTQSLLIEGNKWEILQHLQWRNGSYSFKTRETSPDDKFNLEVIWEFRTDLAAVIGAVRITDEGNNTRIVFVPKPSPIKEGSEKFIEFFRRIKEYFEDTIIGENEVFSETTQVAEKESSENPQKSNSSLINISGNVVGSTIIIGNENKVQSSPRKK